MDSVIWKYNFSMPSDHWFEIPSGGKILTVQEQGGVPTMWVQFKSGAQEVMEKRHFRLIPTGAEFDSSRTSYIGTTQLGPIVLHVYESINAP